MRSWFLPISLYLLLIKFFSFFLHLLIYKTMFHWKTIWWFLKLTKALSFFQNIYMYIYSKSQMLLYFLNLKNSWIKKFYFQMPEKSPGWNGLFIIITTAIISIIFIIIISIAIIITIIITIILSSLLKKRK